MKRSLMAVIGLGITVLGVGCSQEPDGGISTKVPTVHAAAPVKEKPKTMTAFASDAELKHYLREIAEKQRRVTRMHDAMTAGLQAPAPMIGGPLKAEASLAANESITNVQHAGVDECGIVKVHGNYLVVLRRGRLFTVSIEDGDLQPTSMRSARRSIPTARGMTRCWSRRTRLS